MRAVWVDRSFVQCANQPAGIQVDSLTWDATGGCDRAQLSVPVGDHTAWEMINYLRYGVDIYDDKARWVWGGYVHGVTVNDNGVQVGVNLDEMYNCVVVNYTTTTVAGSTTTTTQGTTTAGSDADSISTYGQREIQLSLNNAPGAQGTAYRDTYLEFHKNPLMTVNVSSSGGISAAVELRGWYDTLDWRYYANAGTTTADTVTQITNIINSQTLLAGVIQDATASGVNTNQFRDGTQSCLNEIAELLEVGTTSKLRLLIEVNRLRRARIYTESAVDEYILKRDGLIYDTNGAPVEPWLVRPGKWVRMVGVLPASVGASYFANSKRFMIERVSWYRNQNRATITPRGSTDIQTLFEVHE